ncbi:hypothetical protein [Parendozoicomonas sp. Alg238-R29]|uniref:hypothetical protein n=1 Tax=Parendozoicomonas sp. Alg238-R29 TaxID=2993446 RepID=UPI00248F3A58|nr:hypothetical protein [Parendozoicomonas sp. Alg238-R29]
MATLSGELKNDLLTLHCSPVLSGEQLRQAMGFRTLGALHQAITQQNFPVKLFTIPKRRGRFALVADVAQWLAKQSIENSCDLIKKEVQK